MSAESEIAAQLAESLAKLERAEAAKSPTAAVYAPAEEAPNETPLDPIYAKAQLMDFFQVPSWARNAPEVTGQVQAIMEWAQGEAKYVSEEPTMADVMRVINDQLRVMGSSHEQDRMKKLWQLVRIRQHRRALDERERSLYGG